jgi:hypothetical protein
MLFERERSSHLVNRPLPLQYSSAMLLVPSNHRSKLT